MNKEETITCSICKRIFCEPISLICGHSFCKSCLISKYSYSSSCPTCKEIIHINPYTINTNQILKEILQKKYPREYNNRLLEYENINNRKQILYMPLFVLGIRCFPDVNFPMHIFEQRYRLMIKRVLQGSQTFGLLSNDERGLKDIGICLKITETNLLPDGRSNINTISTQRFKVIEKWIMDDYVMGKVEIINDEKIQMNDLNKIKELFEIYERKIDILKEQNLDRNEELEYLLSNKPNITLEDITIENSLLVEKYSFWICSFIPISNEFKYNILSSINTLERLELVKEIFSQFITDDNPIITIAA